MNTCAKLAAAALVTMLTTACQENATAEVGATWVPQVVARYPHDSNAFTQGLLFHDGSLYESTGRNGQSSLRQVDPESGRVLERHDLDYEYFAEGLALLDDRFYQLTWQAGTAFVYDADDFELLETHSYEGEGWGLTHDGEQLIMSDGSASLRFIDPDTFEVTRTVTVSDGERLVVNLNELEYIDGEVWANIWYDERVARIDPDDGQLLGWIDLSGIYPASQRSSDAVVNGIAWDRDSDRIFVTGKLWPAIYEIEIAERH